MDDKLRPLKNYESMVEALFDQELLRNNGIDSTINHAGHSEGIVDDSLRQVDLKGARCHLRRSKPYIPATHSGSFFCSRKRACDDIPPHPTVS